MEDSKDTMHQEKCDNNNLPGAVVAVSGVFLSWPCTVMPCEARLRWVQQGRVGPRPAVTRLDTSQAALRHSTAR